MKIEALPIADADVLVQARKDKLQAIQNGHKVELIELLNRTIRLFDNAAREVASRHPDQSD